jgi:outer membrane autotransporter protein
VLIDSQSLEGVAGTLSCDAVDTPFASCTFDLLTTNSQLLATLVALELNPKTVLLPAGYRQSLLQLYRCGDLIADGAMASATAEAEGTNRFREFAVMDFASEHYKVDCSTKLRVGQMLLGLATGSGSSALPWTAGGFLSCGSASGKTTSTPAGGTSVCGDGKNKFLGGGALLRAGRAIYLEASVCGGRIRNDWHSDDLLNFPGHRASYDCTSRYGGAHGAMGYRLKGRRVFLNLHGKYFWTKLRGKSLTLNTGDSIDFYPACSKRLRIGGKLSRSPEHRFAPYGGFALEREFSAEGEASAFAMAIVPPSLRGNSFLGELGFSYRPARHRSLTLDFGLRDHFGVRRGMDSTLSARLEF